MVTCSEGHQSVATDYCDVCGSPIGGQPSVPAPAATAPCPMCGVPISGRFCEVCGHDSALPGPAAGAGASSGAAQTSGVSGGSAAAAPGGTTPASSGGSTPASPGSTAAASSGGTTPSGSTSASSGGATSATPSGSTFAGASGAAAAQSGGTTATSSSSAPTASAAATVGTSSSAPSGTTWVATVTADRDFYDRVLARKGPDADQVGFPDVYPERRIILRGSEILIGKRSVSQGLEPDIDLGIAPSDIGVSRSHAVLRITESGVTITDLGSTNGTSLNGSDDLIPARVAVPLENGSRIHLGGWTTIVLGTE